MTRAPLRFPLLAALVLLLATQLLAQDERFVEGPWERRLNRRQPPAQVMDAIGLERAMTVAEVGAGGGRYTVWLADRVGPEGRVLANDVDPDALARLEARCERLGLDNVELVRGEVADPRFPPGVADLAFMVNVYHHLERPVELLRALRPVLRPGGRLAIVERCPERSGRSSDHATPRERVLGELGAAGFDTVAVLEILEEDLIYLAVPRSTDG